MTAAIAINTNYNNNYGYDHASTMKSIFATMDNILSNKNVPASSSSSSSSLFSTRRDEQQQQFLCQHRQRLEESSQRILQTLTTRIDYETEQFEKESRMLSSQVQRVSNLEQNLITLQSDRANMLELKQKLVTSMEACHKAIRTMTTTTSKNSLDINYDNDEGEEDAMTSMNGRTKSTKNSNKKQLIHKIGKELSLHALMTNIRWDYTATTITTNPNSHTTTMSNDYDTDCNIIRLVGEIFHPNSQKMKKFNIEHEDESEIAECLWKLMEE